MKFLQCRACDQLRLAATCLPLIDSRDAAPQNRTPTEISPCLCLARALIFFYLVLPCTPLTNLFAEAHSASNYTRTVWGVAAGLPEDTVQALTETADGQLWIGTTGGLASFDGAHVHAFETTLLQAAGVNSIFVLLRDNDGSVWAGTEGGGLLHVADGRAKLFSVADGLNDGFVRAIFRDSRGVLWVGTDDGLYRLFRSRFQRVDDNGAMPNMAVHSITEDAQHRLWAGGSALISLGPDGSVERYALPGSYSQSRVKKILQTRDGTIWVGTVGGLARLTGSSFQPVANLHATVRSLMEATDGTLWIGTIGDGLWKFRSGTLTPIVPQDLLPSKTVLTLMQDDSGQIWVGTQAGLVRLVPTPVNLLPLPQAGDPDFETIAADNDGSFWVAAQALYHLRGQTAEKVSVAGLPNVRIRNVFRARDGALWLGTDGSGAYRIANGVVRHYSAPAELTNNFPRAFLETRSGDIWIATDEGVSAIAPNGVRQYTPPSGLAYFSTRCMLEDHDGAIWIGTDRGLSAWRNGAFQSNAATAALAREKVWSVLQDSSGALWFGTRDHGLFREKNGHVDQITSDEGLPTNSVYQLLQDRRGVFWITGPNTIASIDKARMEGPLPTRERPLRATVYSMPFGADDAQMYGGREPAGVLASDDTVWFPTTRGIAHIAGTANSAGGPPARVMITGVAEDGRPATLESETRIESGVTRLSFQFAATDLRPRNDLRFRYRLDPLDHDWIAAGTADVATYTNLRPGHYRFRVQVLETDPSTGSSEASAGITKKPFFYQTWWFISICSLGVLGAVWGAYKLRLRRIRSRFAAVLEERSRLAREIHDTVIQGCTGLSAVLEAMAVAEAPGSDRQSPLLDFAREQTRATIDEARQAVWDMRHEREDKVDLAKAMSELAEQTMLEHPEITVEVQARSSLLLRTSELHEVVMVMREAIGNAVQHSGSALIKLTVEASTKALVIRVQDFGRGVEEARISAPPSGHFGIVGMRERMQRLGGGLDIHAAPNAGTTVQLTLPRTRSRKFYAAEVA